MTDEVAARYELDRTAFNLERVMWGLPIAALIHLVAASLFVFSSAPGGVSERWRSLMAIEHEVMLGAVAVLFALVVWAKRTGSELGRRWLPPGIALAYLVYGAVDSSIDQLVTSSITVFVVVSFLFAFLVRLGPAATVAQASAAFTTLVVLHGVYQPDPTLRLSNVGSAMGTSLASVMLALGFSVLRQRDFVHRQTILQQRDELEVAFSRMRELAERAEAANRAKSTFLATMSHEIRTPLNGVLGVTELLSTTELTVDQQALVGTVMEAGQSLRTLIDDILDFSKIEAGQLSIQPTVFDLKAMVEGVRQLFAAGASSKGLTLEVRWPDRAPRWYLGDALRVRQVVSNLVANAVKFTEHGAVRLEVTVEPPASAGAVAQVRLAVVDSGPGLSESQRARLFLPFSQVDASSTRRFGGTGLGLAISRRLVEAMGGAVGVDSVVGQGSTFWVRLPLATAHAAPPVSSGSGISRPLAPARLRGRVLVAEDNSINMLVARQMLRRLGLEVVEAPEGRSALAAFEGAGIDLVLTDLNMPELDGYELARALRQRGVSTPIVALTANVVAEELARCLEVGMNDTLSKPFTLAELERTLRRWLPGDVGRPSGQTTVPSGTTPALGTMTMPSRMK